MKQGNAATVGLYLLAPLLFASNMIGARWLAGDVPPVTLAFGRWAIAAIVLLPIVWRYLDDVRAMWRTRKTDLLLLGLLGGVMSVAPQYAAAQYTQAGHIALVFALTPVLVSLIERAVWKVQMSPQVLCGAAIAFLGIGVSAFEGSVARLMQVSVNPGDLLALVAVIAWASYTARLKRQPVPLPPLALLWVCASIAAMLLLPVAAIELSVNTPSEFLTIKAAAGVVFLALIAGIAAYFIYGRVVTLLGPARASTAMYLVPVYALFLGFLLLHETLHLYHLAAVILVLTGVAMATVHWPGRLNFPHRTRSTTAGRAIDL